MYPIVTVLGTKLSFQSVKESVGTLGDFPLPRWIIFQEMKRHWKGTEGRRGVYNDMKDNLDDEVWEEGDHRVHASSSPTTRKQKQQEKQRLKSSVAGTTGKLKCCDRQGRSKSAQVC